MLITARFVVNMIEITKRIVVNMLNKQQLKRKNFEPDEFFNSAIADKLAIRNYPSNSQEIPVLTCLLSTADAAQEIWEILFSEWRKREYLKGAKINESNFFIKINSGYRSPKINALVGGKPNSQHMQGLAIDFICPSFGTPCEIVEYLFSIGFLADQCLEEGTWVHYSRCLPKGILGKNPNRMQYGKYLINPKTKNREFIKL